jgi:hypothetical protein
VSIDWSLIVDIGAPIIALFVGAALDRVLERRPRLLAYYGHVSSFTLTGPPATVVNTHTVVIVNTGRKSASNIRVGHVFLPSVQVMPSVQFTTAALPSGGHEIVFPQLVPGEQVTLSYLYFPPITWNLVNSYVKSDEGMATVITVLPSRQLPKWQANVQRLLIVLGFAAAIYLAIEAARLML